jgi:hypothetical protein
MLLVTVISYADNVLATLTFPLNCDPFGPINPYTELA